MSDRAVTLAEIDAPGPLAELTTAFEAYERALAANDVNALDAMFWQSPLTLRYGVGENLYGIEEIARFTPRAARWLSAAHPAAHAHHDVWRGVRHGKHGVRARRRWKAGRQSQTWIRLAEGRRIVAAHVSLLADSS